MSKSVDALGKVHERHAPSGRSWRLEGDHSPMCARQKHEDWQHGQHGCAVGPEGPNHCDCKARWREIRPAAATESTKSGGLGE